MNCMMHQRLVVWCTLENTKRYIVSLALRATHSIMQSGVLICDLPCVRLLLKISKGSA